MKRILLAAVALGALVLPASANIIANLGLDPTSATGAFSNSPPGAAPFDDQYTFTLDHSMTLTIDSLTNVFPTPADFISNFTAGIFAGTPALPGIEVLGPQHATTGCGSVAQCQSIAGSIFLNSGTYFLDVSGVDNGTAGYGGNIATFAAVPAPVAGAGLPGALGGLVMAGFAMLRHRRGVAAAI